MSIIVTKPTIAPRYKSYGTQSSTRNTQPPKVRASIKTDSLTPPERFTPKIYAYSDKRTFKTSIIVPGIAWANTKEIKLPLTLSEFG